MEGIDYILLDAANTLIHKPSLWIKFKSVLDSHGYKIPLSALKYQHKILSEIIEFPDVTSKNFYQQFNTELLNSFGIITSETMLSDIFYSCKNLPWEAFPDTQVLQKAQCKIGVLSNFNSKLNLILEQVLPEIKFDNVFISENEGIRKPDPMFFQRAIEAIEIPANRILYIGDSLKLDIIPAMKLGLQTRLIDRDEIFSASNFRIDSLSNIING